MPDLTTLTVYAVGDDGKFLTFDKAKALEQGKESGQPVVAHTYNWADSETLSEEPERSTISTEDAIELYQDGATLSATAKAMDLPIPKAREALIAAGVAIRPRGRPKQERNGD